jgi:hypothetical protein
MRQRAWKLMFAVGLCATTVPGCASSDNCLLKLFGTQEQPAIETKVIQARIIPKYPSGIEEADAPPVADAHEKELWSIHHGEGPVRVPEYMKPPAALTPQPPQVPEHSELVGPLPVAQVIAPAPPAQVEPQEPLSGALYWLLKKRPDKALALLKDCNSSNQEIFIGLLTTLAILNEKSIDQLSTSEVSKLQEQLEELLADSRRRTDLIIDKMILCEHIDGYGQYTPQREGHAYRAGTRWHNGELLAGDRVSIYIELHNITSQRRDPYYTTVLNGTVRVLNSQDQEVYFYNYRKDEKPLQSLLPHFDCYSCYNFNMPAIPPGKYTLTLEIVDETCQPHRVAKKSVEINVAAP